MRLKSAQVESGVETLAIRGGPGQSHAMDRIVRPEPSELGGPPGVTIKGTMAVIAIDLTQKVLAIELGSNAVKIQLRRRS
jgi:hypothetical protein